ncbi:MAG TPA: AsnC family transcriptional regulator [Oceanospirillaceae bacterium]|nr:AsnC family transcriptional regulator [Oceanospirillaceae bacterium]
MQISKQDRQIIALLYQDCRRSNVELAEQVGMSPSACWRRVKALEEAGIIRRYGVVIDEEKLGMNFRAMVDVSLSRHDPENGAKFEQAMSDCDLVVQCYATTGREDYSMLVVCADINAYNDFLDRFLFKLTCVENVLTNVILKEVKRHGLIV